MSPHICPRFILRAGVLSALLGLCPVGPVAAAGSASLSARPTPVNTMGDLQTQVRTTAAKVIPAVVSIASTVMVHDQTFSDEGLPFGMFKDVPPRRQYGQGSGVIVSSDGYIITNNHVVGDAGNVEVILADRRQYKGRVVATDPKTDVAVVKISATGLPTAAWGDSSALAVGDFVLAIGNPLGENLTFTVTSGIISAKGRQTNGEGYQDFLQTDAAINPGNSGGALVDTSGQLIGINTAIYSRAPGGASLGIGFAIPASTAKQVLEQIMQSGQVTRGWIGVGVQDMTRELSTSFKLPEIRGALITEVFRGTPADKAGIKLGDILIAVEGTPVTDSSSMLNLVAALNPGKQATFKVVRSQQETDVKVVVGRRPLQQRQGQ